MKKLARLIVKANKQGWRIHIEGKNFTLEFAPKKEVSYSYKELKQILKEVR